MFANADRAFITYIKHVEIYIVPMSNDIPAEYRVFGRAGEGGALMDATIPALCRRSIKLYIYYDCSTLILLFLGVSTACT